MAAIAADAGEAFGELSAVQVGVQLVADEARKPAGSLGPLEEGEEVAAHDLVEHGARGIAPALDGGTR